jgi:hypothetical protein
MEGAAPMTISLIGILVTLIIIGAILYIIQLLPIDATIKRICYVVMVLFVLLWLLQMLGAIGPTIKLGQGGQNLQNSALC